MSEPAPAARTPDLRAALRALCEDADAFGVLGYGSEARATAAAASGSAPPGRAEPAKEPSAAREAPSTAPATGAAEDSAAALARLADEVRACRLCPLGALRTHAVPGTGNPRAEIVFVGEAPGADEDRAGLPFVGAAGDLLTKMIAAMGFAREDVFIANVLKCRPPGNRDPAPEEVAQCRTYLDRQLEAIGPRVVVALGAHAARATLGTELSVGRLRGTPHERDGRRVVVTYHPAYLLRSPGEKAKTWEDLKLALKLLGREPPPRRAPEPVP